MKHGKWRCIWGSKLQIDLGLGIWFDEEGNEQLWARFSVRKG